MADNKYILEIPPKGSKGRGKIAYMIYMLEDDATWAYVDNLFDVAEGVAWQTARKYAKRRGLQWPPVDHLKVKYARR